MSRVTNAQLLAAISEMVHQVDALSTRVSVLEGGAPHKAATSKPRPKPQPQAHPRAAIPVLAEGTAIPVGHLVIVKIRKGLNREEAANCSRARRSGMGR
jgi:hypothetical protein